MIRLRDQLSVAQSRRDGIQRVVRNARDPSLTQAQRRVKALQDELDALWERRRSVIIDNFGSSSNSEVEAAIRHEEANLIVLTSRESVLREEMAAIQLAASDSGARLPQTLPLRQHPTQRRQLAAVPVIPTGTGSRAMLDSIERGFKANEAMQGGDDAPVQGRSGRGEGGRDRSTRGREPSCQPRAPAFILQLRRRSAQAAQLVSDHSTITAQLVHPPSAAAFRPRQAIVLALALFIGSGLGVACAFVADLFDDRLRTLPALRGPWSFPCWG